MSEEIQGRVSVMIPARNEEANIERAVRSLAAQRGVREIIVVDDQSTDRTGEILEDLKKEFPNLRTLRIESLPSGWTGKTNALATAAHAACGEWYLFTDADTEHRQGSLAALLARAESEHADLLSLSPGQRVPTWWEKAVIPLVYAGLARRFKFEDVSDPLSPAAAANGQYILVNRDMYRRSGGHEAVRWEVLDDVALARRVKSTGGRILFLPGAAWAETRMYRTFGQMWEGWAKNLYTLYGGKLTNTMEEVLSAIVLDFLPAVGFAIFLFLWIMSIPISSMPRADSIGTGICLLLVAARYTSYRHRLLQLGFGSATAFYLFVGAPIYAALLLNSARAHLTGRVRWKGREYKTGNSSGGT